MYRALNVWSSVLCIIITKTKQNTTAFESDKPSEFLERYGQVKL